MGDLVNLRIARKRKARAEREDEAGRNRLTHGRTKAEKMATRGENARAEKAHAAGRLDRSPASAGDPPRDRSGR